MLSCFLRETECTGQSRRVSGRVDGRRRMCCSSEAKDGER